MEEVNLVWEGIKFMFLGMGTVLVFLMVMIFAMDLQRIIIQKFFPEKKITIIQQQGDEKARLNKIAAITAAIIHHKQVNG